MHSVCCTQLMDLHVFTVPSAPVNVTVERADPHRLKVLWCVPLTPNGPRDSLRYEIKWTKKQDSTVSTGKVEVLPNITRGSTSSGRYNYHVDNLRANTTYTIQVKISAHKQCTYFKNCN